MTVFVAVAALDGRGSAPLGAGSLAALRLQGAQPAVLHAEAGFACATAATRQGADGLFVAGGIVVAGDVRLDGRAELVRRLRGADVPDRGNSYAARAGAAGDLELVYAAYQAWGPSAVERLRGDFAFVLWDGRQRTIFGARDGLGVRPLYYACTASTLCLSNSLDAVRLLDGVGQSLNSAAIVSFLQHGWNLDTATTTFASVARLPPGTMIRHAAGSGAPAVSVHWTMPDPDPLVLADDEAYIERYRALLDEAVRDRIADRTVIQLSGGLDSPSIAATAQRVAAGAHLHAVTTRVDGVESAEESRLAAAVAARVGIGHEVRHVGVVPLLPLGHATPEPYDDPDLATQSALFSKLGELAPVVLQGEDGDALFAPPSLRAMLARGRPFDVIRQVAAYTVRHGHHPYLGFWLSRRLRFWRRPGGVRPGWLRPGVGASAAEPALAPNRARPEAARRLAGSIWQSVHQGTDRAFLGAPVEFRWPLLDTRLIEFVFAIPPVPWCQRKFLVRRAYARDLPAEVISREKSTVPGYFEYAVAEWRRRTGGVTGPLHEQTAEFVDARLLGDLFRRGGTEEVVAGWRALTLDRWFRDRAAA